MKKILAAIAVLLLIGIVAANAPYDIDSQLTNEQRATLRARARELWEKGATHLEITTEIQTLLKEFGIETATQGFSPGYGHMAGMGMNGMGAMGMNGMGAMGMNGMGAMGMNGMSGMGMNGMSGMGMNGMSGMGMNGMSSNGTGGCPGHGMMGQ